ncbi:MAG: hypothetical protein ACXABY_20710 [Candidatus Thorarchaeota archaeon]|jgi:hypothetical protein
MLICKVVRNVRGVLKSFLPSDYEVTYPIQDYAHPVVGKIFAFASYQDAWTFYKKENCYRDVPIGQIWSADAEICEFHIGHIASIDELSMTDIVVMFEGKVDNLIDFDTLPLPKGTVFCNWVYLRKRLL